MRRSVSAIWRWRAVFSWSVCAARNCPWARAGHVLGCGVLSLRYSAVLPPVRATESSPSAPPLRRPRVTTCGDAHFVLSDDGDLLLGQAVEVVDEAVDAPVGVGDLALEGGLLLVGVRGGEPLVQLEHPFHERDHLVVAAPVGGVGEVDGVDGERSSSFVPTLLFVLVRRNRH